MHAFLNIITAFQGKALIDGMACEGVCKHYVTCVALVTVVCSVPLYKLWGFPTLFMYSHTS